MIESLKAGQGLREGRTFPLAIEGVANSTKEEEQKNSRHEREGGVANGAILKTAMGRENDCLMASFGRIIF